MVAQHLLGSAQLDVLSGHWLVTVQFLGPAAGSAEVAPELEMVVRQALTQLPAHVRTQAIKSPMVLVGSFAGLRLGEMLALTRERVDPLHGRIKVVEQCQELKDGSWVLGPPKSEAGVRTVAIPAMLQPELEAHFAMFGGSGKKGPVFCRTDGRPLRRVSWYTEWGRAMKALDIEGLKPHDLRHTGNTLAAMTGASTKELMARFGQSTSMQVR